MYLHVAAKRTTTTVIGPLGRLALLSTHFQLLLRLYTFPAQAANMDQVEVRLIEEVRHTCNCVIVHHPLMKTDRWQHSRGETFESANVSHTTATKT